MSESDGKERAEAWNTDELVKTSRTPEENEEMVSDAVVGIDIDYEVLGVDQMICQAYSPVFIPVSEINLRMTMGLIARNKYDHCKPAGSLHR